MTGRERVLRAINQQETDRIPIDFPGATPELWSSLKAALNVATNEEVYRLIGRDIRKLRGLDYVGPKRFHMGEEADYWGVSASAAQDGDSSGKCPLKNVSSVDDVEEYQWPSPNDFSGELLAKEIETCDNVAISAGLGCEIFHNFIWMCGFENALVFLQTEPAISAAILRRITDFWIGCARKALEIGRGRIDIVDSYNDLGTQCDLLISPAIFRKLLKPEFKRLFDTIKEYDAKVFVHSCGSISRVIEDLIEIGCDILDPIQVSADAMDPKMLKENFGGRITFHGAIDTQHVMPEGTADDVRAEVRRITGILGKGGGYILSGSQNFEDDISVESILAMYDEAKKMER